MYQLAIKIALSTEWREQLIALETVFIATAVGGSAEPQINSKQKFTLPLTPYHCQILPSVDDLFVGAPEAFSLLFDNSSLFCLSQRKCTSGRKKIIVRIRSFMRQFEWQTAKILFHRLSILTPMAISLHPQLLRIKTTLLLLRLLCARSRVTVKRISHLPLPPPYRLSRYPPVCLSAFNTNT